MFYTKRTFKCSCLPLKQAVCGPHSPSPREIYWWAGEEGGGGGGGGGESLLALAASCSHDTLLPQRTWEGWTSRSNQPLSSLSHPPPALQSSPLSSPALTSRSYLSESGSEGMEHASLISLTKVAPLAGVAMPMESKRAWPAQRLMAVLDCLPMTLLETWEVRKKIWCSSAGFALSAVCVVFFPPPWCRRGGVSLRLLATPSLPCCCTVRNSCMTCQVSPDLASFPGHKAWERG